MGDTWAKDARRARGRFELMQLGEAKLDTSDGVRMLQNASECFNR